MNNLKQTHKENNEMAPQTNFLAQRIFRCSGSDFYHNEIEVVNETHSDERLKAIADAGFTGVWLHGEIRQLVATKLFKDHQASVDKAQNALRLLCQRAEAFGLGIWLYFTEPLGLLASDPFWKTHLELAGHETTIPPLMDFTEKDPRLALCSSTPQVNDYLREGFTKLFEAIALEGVILVTTSEHVSNCWAHVLSTPENYSVSAEAFWAETCNCPRCEKLGPLEVISNIIDTINIAIISVRPDAKVVAWDWSWNMHFTPPYKEIIERLAPNVILMGDFERGLIKPDDPGSMFEDYTMMYPGPNNRFRGEVALTAGSRDMLAILRINTTFELATVPNLPLMVSMLRKYAYLHEAKISGAMATWNIGCFINTLNVFAFDKFCKNPGQYHEREWLESLATDYFGPSANTSLIVDGWYGFQDGGSHYPINGNKFIYFSPTSYALAYPLFSKFANKPMGLSAIEQVEYGDRLEDSLLHLQLEDVVNALKNLSTKWLAATIPYGQGLSTAENKQSAENELGVAIVAGCSFRSAYNIYRWYQQRKDRTSITLTDENREIVLDEINNLQKALPYIEKDDRLGFQQEANCYMYTAEKITGKINELNKFL